MFIVVQNKSMYPEVKECETIEEAQILRDKIISWNHYISSQEPFTVYIAEVKDATKFRPEEE